MTQVSSLPPMPDSPDDSAMKLGLKLAAITAVVLLVLFGLYWAGRQWLLPTPAGQESQRQLPAVAVTECDETYTDLLQALIDFGQLGKKICGIDMSNANFLEITVGVSFIKELRILRASDNFIKEMPEWMGEMSKLELLDVANNRIESIPVSLGQLTNLKVLDLTGNPLEPAEVENIRKLLPNTAVKF